jgi:hypothetical protein
MSKSKGKDTRAPKGVKVNERPSDAVSPPVSDSTLKAVKQLIPKAKKLPRKGWGD